ncbi:MAG TPA: hypothetical protein VEL07_09585, partial [Planctomycetota bacterium]|nr:hypothetical protein [Planctomycetota bacterium]
PPPDPGWRREPGNPLVMPELTASTIWYSAADPCVLYDAAESRWKAWWSCGIKDRATDEEEVLIRYAESADGVAWTVQAAPAFRRTGDAAAWDHTTNETPSVVRNPDPAAPGSRRWLLFYSGANSTLAAAEGRPTTFPYYAIGLAYSADGRSFARHLPGIGGKPGLIMRADAAMFAPGHLPITDGVVADPEVLVEGTRLTMWCSSFAENAPSPPTPTGRAVVAFGISRAVSEDGGVTWTFPQANPLPSLRKPGDVAGGAQPSVLRDPASGLYHLWFSNDTAAELASIPATMFTAYGFWHATSPDGIAWTPDYGERDFRWDPTLAYERHGLITGVEVVQHAGEYRLFYGAWGDVGIPDPSLFLVPLQGGTLAPGAFCLCGARRTIVPGAISRRPAWRRLAASATP